jgi:hypothetical protein
VATRSEIRHKNTKYRQLEKKKKRKFVPVKAMKSYRHVKVQFNSFLTSALDGNGKEYPVLIE